MFYISATDKDPVHSIVSALINGQFSQYANIRQYIDGSYLIGSPNDFELVRSYTDFTDFGSVHNLLSLMLQE